MSDHSKVLVPVESWCYSSPQVRLQGSSVDIGLMAEALIYYDQILINPTSPLQLAEIMGWFIKQQKYKDFISLLEDGTIQIYDYAFMTAAIQKDDSYSLWNIDDPISQKPNSFEQRFLYHNSIDTLFHNSRERRNFYRILRGRVIEAKAVEFGPAINNAREDYINPHRSALVLQTMLDEVYPLLGLGKPPLVTANVQKVGTNNRINYNLNLNELIRLIGPRLNFHLGMPLTAIAICNRLIWSAAQLNLDLYLGNPMATLAGDKLYESQAKALKTGTLIDQLSAEVEFPDIRNLVNQRKIGLETILEIRKKGRRFREWLQQESERDRNALIAYHQEVANETGLVTLGRKSLRLFGVLSSIALEACIGSQSPEFQSLVLGGAVGAGTSYLFNIASKIGESWKPVIFGDWMKDRIEKIIKEQR